MEETEGMNRIQGEKERMKELGKKSVIKFLDSVSKKERREWITSLFPNIGESVDTDQFCKEYRESAGRIRNDPNGARKARAEYTKRYYTEHRMIFSKRRGNMRMTAGQRSVRGRGVTIRNTTG